MPVNVTDSQQTVPPLQMEAVQTASELMEAMPVIMQFVRVEMRRQRAPSLSVPQFRVLAFLSHNPDSSLSDVAEHIGITRATASPLIDRLVQRGLVDRREDPTERRHIQLKLTSEGHDRLEEIRNSTRQKLAELLDEMTSEELEQVSAGLALLSRVFKTAQ